MFVVGFLYWQNRKTFQAELSVRREYSDSLRRQGDTQGADQNDAGTENVIKRRSRAGLLMMAVSLSLICIRYVGFGGSFFR